MDTRESFWKYMELLGGRFDDVSDEQPCDFFYEQDELDLETAREREWK